MMCAHSMASKVIYNIYGTVNVLFFFPLYIFVLYMGFKQWRHWHSAPTGMLMSHSDFFTFNIVIVEILGVLGSSAFTLDSFLKNDTVLVLGLMTFSFIISGQTLFHVLTCVDRYLAVVYPISYMQLKESFGVRIRNFTTVCAWLACFGWAGQATTDMSVSTSYQLIALVGLGTGVTLFCCVSVIRVLTRSGPGGVGRCSNRTDQSKQRALHIITAITAVLLLRFVGLLISCVLEHIVSFDEELICPLLDSGVWLLVPSSLVLPLLFLHRAGKLSCCRRATESR